MLNNYKTKVENAILVFLPSTDNGLFYIKLISIIYKLIAIFSLIVPIFLLFSNILSIGNLGLIPFGNQLLITLLIILSLLPNYFVWTIRQKQLYKDNLYSPLIVLTLSAHFIRTIGESLAIMLTSFIFSMLVASVFNINISYFIMMLPKNSITQLYNVSYLVNVLVSMAVFIIGLFVSIFILLISRFFYEMILSFCHVELSKYSDSKNK